MNISGKYKKYKFGSTVTSITNNQLNDLVLLFVKKTTTIKNKSQTCENEKGKIPAGRAAGAGLVLGSIFRLYKELLFH